MGGGRVSARVAGVCRYTEKDVRTIKLEIDFMIDTRLSVAARLIELVECFRVRWMYGRCGIATTPGGYWCVCGWRLKDQEFVGHPCIVATSIYATFISCVDRGVHVSNSSLIREKSPILRSVVY